MSKKLHEVSKVGVYLRKSRETADSDDTLKQHRDTLQEYIKREGFVNVEWFEELKSAESIQGRPIFSSLLNRIKDGEFDGILVVAFDRLSRGSMQEQGAIQDAFKESNTLLVTPDGITDFTDVDQSFQSSLIGLMSNWELEQIKRRLAIGKKRAVKDGRMATGRVPFPYVHDKNLKKAIVDDENLKTYHFMIDCYINKNMSVSQIADKLHEMKIPSPNGYPKWSTAKVNSIIQSRFHLGLVYSGMYKSHKVYYIDEDGQQQQRWQTKLNDNKDEYIEVQGTHEAVKTQEEHALIMELLEKRGAAFRKDRRNTPKRKRLQSLVRCPYCKRALAITHTRYGVPYIQKCKSRSVSATAECKTHTTGINEDVIYYSLIDHLQKYKDVLFSSKEDHNTNEKRLNILREKIDNYTNAIDKSNGNIDRAKYMTIEGLLSTDEFRKVKDDEETSVRNNKHEISLLEEEAALLDDVKSKQVKERFQSKEVVDLLAGKDESYTTEEINETLRTLVDIVTYHKGKDNHVSVKVEYP